MVVCLGFSGAEEGRWVGLIVVEIFGVWVVCVVVMVGFFEIVVCEGGVSSG